MPWGNIINVGLKSICIQGLLRRFDKGMVIDRVGLWINKLYYSVNCVQKYSEYTCSAFLKSGEFRHVFKKKMLIYIHINMAKDLQYID